MFLNRKNPNRALDLFLLQEAIEGNIRKSKQLFLLQEAIEGIIRKNKQLLTCMIDDEVSIRHKNEQLLT